MNIHLASDHAGFEMKNNIHAWLQGKGYHVIDHGPQIFNPHDDYPEFMHVLGQALMHFPEDRAIVFGGSGQGEAIVVNRYTHLRCAVYYGGNEEIIRLSRQHNNANVLSLGARFITDQLAQSAIQIFLETDFSNEERHIRRLQMINV